MVGKNPELVNSEVQSKKAHLADLNAILSNNEEHHDLINLEIDKMLFNNHQQEKAGIFGTLLLKKVDKNFETVKNKCITKI